jgi:hypothetical protein
VRSRNHCKPSVAGKVYAGLKTDTLQNLRPPERPPERQNRPKMETQCTDGYKGQGMTELCEK